MTSPLAHPPLSPAAAEYVARWNQQALVEVQQAVATTDVVVVGMRLNPHPRRVRKALDAANIAYSYLGYGSYLSGWKSRLAIKLWSGWPTFPQVFVKGILVGGADQTIQMLKDGTLKQLIERERPH